LKYSRLLHQQIIDLATAVYAGYGENVYIHCHHGKHRAAAAAAIAQIALGNATSIMMKKRMYVSETSPLYAGLWESVEEQVVLNPLVYVHSEDNLKNSVTPTGITESMINIEFAFEQLQILQQSNWEVPNHHPDLVASSEAGIITESLRQLQNSFEIEKYPKDFSKKLIQAIGVASALEEIILQNNDEPEQIKLYLQALKSSCTSCHRKYRK